MDSVILLIGIVVGMVFGACAAMVFESAKQDDLANEINMLELEIERVRWINRELTRENNSKA